MRQGQHDFANRLRWLVRRPTMLAGLPPEAAQQERLLAVSDLPGDTASRQGTVRRVMRVLQAVTGEPRLVLHHLRHACATWLWLKLRAPDYPEVVHFVASMPALCQELGQARRLRVLLCGATSGPSRVYSNVVARILGHGMPGTSLEHYIHVADLFLAASTTRVAKATPVEVWHALTGDARPCRRRRPACWPATRAGPEATGSHRAAHDESTAQDCAGGPHGASTPTGRSA